MSNIVRPVEADGDAPLVWTTKGNLPVAECEHFIEWQDTQDSMTFIESYRHGGEEVRRDAHVYMKRSPSALGSEQAALGE